MKKLLSTALLCLLSVTFVPAVGSASSDYLVTKGTVTKGKVSDTDTKAIILQNEDTKDSINLILSDKTHIFQSGTGYYLNFDDIKIGQSATAYHEVKMTKSIPPASHAKAVVVGENAPYFRYFKVGKKMQNADGSVVLFDVNKDQYVTVTPDVYSNINDIDEGDEMLLWYDIATLSLPSHATATKAYKLEDSTDIDINVTTQTITLKNTILFGVTMFEENNTLYVPIRSIAEAMGYTVNWDNNSKSVIMQRGAHSVNFTIGQTMYGREKMLVKLNNAPILFDNITMVPVEMFDTVLDYDYKISASPK